MQSRGGINRKLQDGHEEIDTQSNKSSSRKQNDLPPELLTIVWSALQVGSLTGMSGAFVGGLAGVLRATSPVLFALASGIQWFALGSTFWASRSFLLHNWSQTEITSRDKVSASAIAGGVSGFVGGALRGRRNVIPGTMMFALFGAAGQIFYSSINSPSRSRAGSDHTTKHSWLNSKWSPMKSLSDEEYEAMLREKLLRVDAEIAILDDKISKIQAEEQQLLSQPT